MLKLFFYWKIKNFMGYKKKHRILSYLLKVGFKNLFFENMRLISERNYVFFY